MYSCQVFLGFWFGEERDSQLSFIFLHLVQSNYFLRIDVECRPTSICCYTVTDKRKASTPASVIRQLERNLKSYRIRRRQVFHIETPCKFKYEGTGRTNSSLR